MHLYLAMQTSYLHANLKEIAKDLTQEMWAIPPPPTFSYIVILQNLASPSLTYHALTLLFSLNFFSFPISSQKKGFMGYV